MASKLVTDRQKAAEAVAAVAGTHGSALSERVRAELVKGGARVAPDPKGLIEALTVCLTAARDAMVAADAAHESELADDPGARAERDGLAAELYGQLVELREVVTGLFGGELGRAVFAGPTPQDPVVLARYAGEVLDRLKQTTLPRSRVPGTTLDKAALVANLQKQRAELERALEAVAREEREAEVTLVAKNRAITDYDRVFQGVANVLRGLFILSGQGELAERVRPSARRPGQRAADDAATPASTSPA